VGRPEEKRKLEDLEVSMYGNNIKKCGLNKYDGLVWTGLISNGSTELICLVVHILVRNAGITVAAILCGKSCTRPNHLAHTVSLIQSHKKKSKLHNKYLYHTYSSYTILNAMG
jgi:hypothetical protein